MEHYFKTNVINRTLSVKYLVVTEAHKNIFNSKKKVKILCIDFYRSLFKITLSTKCILKNLKFENLNLSALKLKFKLGIISILMTKK